jgi:hypothetical protein
MNLREADRFTVQEIAGGKAGVVIAKCRFDFNRDLRGDLVDLSLKGFGIEIRNITSSLIEEIKSMGNYMITIDFGNEAIMAAVKNVWNMVLFENGSMIFRGGVAIDVMSPGDRVLLLNLIEKTRSGR